MQKGKESEEAASVAVGVTPMPPDTEEGRAASSILHHLCSFTASFQTKVVTINHPAFGSGGTFMSQSTHRVISNRT